MSFLGIAIIAVALAMDAFGISISIGINESVRRSNKICFILSFAFFQSLMSLIGGGIGYLFNNYIACIPNLIGGVIIAIVGVLMLKEGVEDKQECILTKTKMYFILGISVSIDALVVGFTTLNNVGSVKVLVLYTLFIGLVTGILCAIAFYLSRIIKKLKFIANYADYIGGIILIIFGVKMMFF